MRSTPPNATTRQPHRLNCLNLISNGQNINPKVSMDKDTCPGNGLSPSTQTRTTQACCKTLPEDPMQKETASSKDNASNVQVEETSSTEISKPTSTSTSTLQSSLLASLWSPLSSLQKSILGSPSNRDSTTSSASPGENEPQDRTVSTEDQSTSTSETTAKELNPNRQPQSSTSDSKATTTPSPKTDPNPNARPSTTTQSTPTPCLSPTKTPTYIRLQKTRLSGVRTKQLLRAGSRAYNDPPPPPELGTCCGSSCDPCVNDLWREERAVWREVWGVNAVEGKEGEGRKGLEW